MAFASFQHVDMALSVEMGVSCGEVDIAQNSYYFSLSTILAFLNAPDIPMLVSKNIIYTILQGMPCLPNWL